MKNTKSSMRQLIDAMADCQRAEIALGFQYLVDDGENIRIVDANDMSNQENQAGGECEWFGREDVMLLHPVPATYQELIRSKMTSAKLSQLLYHALDAFEDGRDNVDYMIGREIGMSLEPGWDKI